jgi:adenosylhomocysteine nucleosidase
MESGAVARVAARHGLPFAVLRAICDPAERDLPPASLTALDDRGRIQPMALLRSLARNPAQIGALIRVGRDAALARRALLARVEAAGAIQ